MSEPYNKTSQRGFSSFKDHVSASGSSAFEADFSLNNRYSDTWVDSLSGWKNPRWRRQVALGQNASTSMDAIRCEITHEPGYMVAYGNVTTNMAPTGRRKNGYSGLIYGSVSAITPGVVEQGKADNDAAGKYYQKLSQAYSGFKGQIAGGESREALRMMKTRSQSIIDTIAPWQERLKRVARPIRIPRQRLRTVSDSYLELMFGWGPMVSDINDAHSVLNNPQTAFKKVVARGEHRNRTSLSDSGVTSGILTYRTSLVETTSYQVQYLGIAQVRPNGTSALADFGLQTREFVPTLWELLPWSFLVDYFTNVGKIITAASYYGASGSVATKTVRQSRKRVYRAHSAAVSSSAKTEISVICIPSSLVVNATSVSRRTQTEVPIPSLTFKVPGLKQGLNMAALAISKRLRLTTFP